MFRDQRKLFKSPEATVCQYLRPVPPKMATDAVGQDEAIGDSESFIESKQKNENKKVKIVDIVGLGGSGKTVIFRCLLFERSSFLFDLPNESNSNALPDLQCNLLQDLLHAKYCKIDRISEGKGVKHRADVTSNMLFANQIFLDVASFFLRDIASKESPRRLWNESQAANLREQQKAIKRA